MCLCGDSQCPSCGSAQGTLDDSDTMRGDSGEHMLIMPEEFICADCESLGSPDRATECSMCKQSICDTCRKLHADECNARKDCLSE